MEKDHKRRYIGGGVACFVVSLAMATGVYAQSGPALMITAPEDGAKIEGPSVTVRWESEGVTIVPAAKAKTREEAHYHLFLDREDDQLVPDEAIPRGLEKEGIYHTAQDSLELTDLKPGAHSITVVLGYNDHVPWEPLVFDTISFIVEEPKKKP